MKNQTAAIKSTVKLIDRKIQLLRREYQNDKQADESESFALLVKIDQLQRCRHGITGDFLAASDGNVHYLDIERGLWFKFYKPLEVMVG